LGGEFLPNFGVKNVIPISNLHKKNFHEKFDPNLPDLREKKSKLEPFYGGF
jgi:hypothetical protein